MSKTPRTDAVRVMYTTGHAHLKDAFYLAQELEGELETALDMLHRAVKESAAMREDSERLDSVVKNCWLVHQGNETKFAVFDGTDYITPWLPSVREAIDAARKTTTL